MRQLYMASPHVEWSPFAKSMGWSPTTSRNGLDVTDWIAEKRDLIAREQAETIAEEVFGYRSRWHVDVLKTLKEYPEANDAMLGLLKRRLNDMIRMVNEDDQAVAAAARVGVDAPPPRFAKVPAKELASLASAIKICTESKHKSLLIGDWSFRVAETFSDPRQFQEEEAKAADMQWRVNIMGTESMTSSELQAAISRWYDGPAMPHDADEAARPTDPIATNDDEGG